MTKEVVVKICGLQVVEDTKDAIETMSTGTYYKKNEKHYLFYEEIDEETKVETKNSIKFDNETVEITKKGGVNSKLSFNVGKLSQALYSTPFGDLLIETETENIEIEEVEEEIVLKIKYKLFINNDKVSDSEIELLIKAA